VEISTREIVHLTVVPALLLIITLLFILLWNIFGLPPPEDLVQHARKFYFLYGYWVVFISGLVEGLIVVGWYLPGSVTITLGIVFCQGDPSRALVTVVVVILAFTIAGAANYALGRFGWHLLLLRFGLESLLKRTRVKLAKHGLSLILMTYFHPNIGSVTAMTCGILRISFSTFLAYLITAITIWNALWGMLIYLVGSPILQLLNLWIFVAVLGAWTLFGAVRVIWANKQNH
jgi:membrane protein DedA with SNARE-associated domain